MQHLGLVKHREGTVTDLNQAISLKVHINTVDVVEHYLDMAWGLGQDSEGLYRCVSLLRIRAHPLVGCGRKPQE